MLQFLPVSCICILLTEEGKQVATLVTGFCSQDSIYQKHSRTGNRTLSRLVNSSGVQWCH